MTPEKRLPEEEATEQEAKRLKQDTEGDEEGVDEVPECDEDDNTKDSVASDTASTSSDDKKAAAAAARDYGTLVYCGCVQWDFIGRRNNKAIPAMQHFSPRRIKAFAGIKVSFITSHSSAAHSVILTQDGQVWTLGRNEKGQLGCGDTEVHGGPMLVESLSEHVIVSAAVGRNHSLFLSDTGALFGCGENKSGQCGVGNTTPILTTPVQVTFKDGRICKIACGAEFSMLIDQRGYLYSFGCPEYGQLGHNTDGKYFVTSNKISYQFETSPRRIPMFVECNKGGHPTPVPDVQIVDVACGNNHTVALDAKKRAYAWGFGGYGRLGHAEPKDEMIPRLIKFFQGHNHGVNKVYSGGAFSIANTQLGVYLWGQTKRTGEANMYPKPIQDLYGWNVRSIGCSGTSIVVAADTNVISWGPSPTCGELGLGDNVKSSTQPKEVKLLEGLYMFQVACGYGHTLHIARDSTENDQKLLAKLKEITL